MSAQTIAWQDSIHLALEECYLCQNCHRVGNSAIRCPACASETSLMSLASALARPSDSDRLAGIARAVDALEAAFVLPELDAELSAWMREEGKGRG